MKKYIYSIIALSIISGFTFQSCEDDLNVELRDAQSEADFLANPNNAVQLVNGVYNKLLDYNMYSFSWIGMTSITSDDADKGSSAGDNGSDKHKMDNLTFQAMDVSFKDVWEGRYDGIYRANNALYYLNLVELEENYKSRLLGEVYFLRALFYFDLVRCYGGVPLVTTRIDINDSEQISQTVYVRKSKEECYAQIEADLLDAMNRLPATYTGNDVGRATKNAAQALLSKVYLYEQKWQQSYDAAGDVIGTGQYALLADYAQVWRQTGENGLESIFEVQAALTKGLVDFTNVQGPRGTPDLGWGFNTPTIKLSNTYEPGDLRKEATILYVPSTLWDGFTAPTTWTNPRYNYKAYQSSVAEDWNDDKGNTAKNYRVLKYSDILLIRAEAASHLGMDSEATLLVNQIRNRAGLANLSNATLTDVLKERHLEMAMEYDRWFDIVRTGTAAAVMAADGKTFQTGVHEVFPIPQTEIIKSGGLLLQNPGY